MKRKKKGKNEEGANSIASSSSSLCLTSFYYSLLSSGYSPTPLFCCLGNWSRPLLLCFLLCPGGMRIGQAFALIVSGV
jgi:hypothetical protein